MKPDKIAAVFDAIPTHRLELPTDQNPLFYKKNRITGEHEEVPENAIFTNIALAALQDQLKRSGEAEHPYDWPDMSDETARRLQEEPMFQIAFEMFVRDYGFYHDETFQYEFNNYRMSWVMGSLVEKYKAREIATVPWKEGRKAVFHRWAYEAICHLDSPDMGDICIENYCGFCDLIAKTQGESETKGPLSHLDFSMLACWYRRTESPFQPKYVTRFDFEDFYHCLENCENPIRQDELWLYETVYQFPQDVKTKHTWIRGLNNFLVHHYQNDVVALLRKDIAEEHGTPMESELPFQFLERFNTHTIPRLYWYLEYFGENEDDVSAYNQIYARKISPVVTKVGEDPVVMEACKDRTVEFPSVDPDELEQMFPFVHFSAHWAYLLLDEEQQQAFWEQKEFWGKVGELYGFTTTQWYHALQQKVLSCRTLQNPVPKLEVFQPLFPKSGFNDFFTFLDLEEADQKLVLDHQNEFAEIVQILAPGQGKFTDCITSAISLFRGEEGFTYELGDAGKVRNLFGKANTNPDLVFAYWSLDPDERALFETQFEQRCGALVSTCGRVVDTTQNTFSGLVFSVLSRVEPGQFRTAVSKVDFDSVPETDRVFARDHSISIPLLSRDYIGTTGETLTADLAAKILKYVEMDNGPVEVLKEANMVIDQAVTHLRKLGKSKVLDVLNEHHYGSLEAFFDLLATDGPPLLVQLLQLQQQLPRNILVPCIVRLFVGHLQATVPHILQGIQDFAEDFETLVRAGQEPPAGYASQAPIFLEFFNEINEQAETLMRGVITAEPIVGPLQEMVSEFFHRRTIRPILEQFIETSTNSSEPEMMSLWISGAARNELDCFYEKDTCSRGPEEIMNPDFKLLRLLNENKTKIVGFIWCLEQNHPDYGKTLILSDIQPDLELRGTYDPEALFGQVLSHLEDCKTRGKYDMLMMTTAGSALSNDPLLKRVMKRRIKNADVVEFPETIKLPSESGVDISKCVVLSRTAKKPEIQRELAAVS